MIPLVALMSIAWVPVHRGFWHSHFKQWIRKPTELPKPGLNLYIDDPYHSTDYDVTVNLQNVTAFAENYVGTLQSVTPIPIGIPTHTWRKHAASFLAHAHDSIPFSKKPIGAYSNSHFVTYTGHSSYKLRQSLLANKNIIHEAHRTTPPEFWKTLNNFTFVISPPGRGIDCHRTWEGLFMNTIPIVLSGPLNRLHRQYPIVIVDSWNEITPNALLKWHSSFKDTDWIKVRNNLDAGNLAMRVLDAI